MQESILCGLDVCLPQKRYSHFVVTLLRTVAAPTGSALEKTEEFADALGAAGVFGNFQNAQMSFQGVGLLLQEGVDLRHDLELVIHEQ